MIFRLWLALLLAAGGAAEADEVQVTRGKTLFDRGWSVESDGLGPLYNAISCAECHPGGGAAPADLGIVVRFPPDPLRGRQLQTRAVQGVTPEVMPDASTGKRRAPSIRGVGLLARIAPADLKADPDDADGDGIVGRIGAGRFGWKAVFPNLREQIASALHTDLGLSSPDFPDPWGDCTVEQVECRTAAGPPRIEIDAPDLAALVAYVGSTRPRSATPANDAGLALFERTGCAGCHRPSYRIPADPAVVGVGQEVIYPFTDLLLHDMGSDLAEPFDDDGVSGREWRTPPLWDLGLALAQPRPMLLHDGRAATIDEAIRWHGGEAGAARATYLALPDSERQQLLGFLARL
ncbi:MAG: di-heme oxidoredictase family protein [Geminicoccaceae bacterium]